MRDDLLKEVMVSGDVQKSPDLQGTSPLFGEMAQEWIGIKAKEIKSSTLRDYRCSMNYHILPKLGNRPIREIGYLEIKKFIAGMKCSGKRVKNVLVPMREVFKFAQLCEVIDKNPMTLIPSPKVE